MIPILFHSSETAFTSNGLGRLADCISCIVTEERNGIYECEFQYPVTGEMYSQITEGNIIGVIHDDAHDIQPFDIYAHSAPIDGVVTFYAHHISYRLGNIILKPMTATSCAAAMAAIPSRTYNPCPFTFWTDKSVTSDWKNGVPSAVKAILGGQQGSILDVYGKGEYEWDKWTVKLHLNRGNDNGVSIRYGVNLMDLTQDYDISGVYSAAAPYWQSAESGAVVSLPEGYVIASSAPILEEPWTDHNGNVMQDGNGNDIVFRTPKVIPVPMDLSAEFETAPTQAELRAKALQKLNSSEAWLPNENIKVSFVDLAHTEEYKDVAALQRVKLCDRVNVYCGPLGINAVSMQVVRVVFNSLTELYDEIELGKAKTSFADTIMASVEAATANLPTINQVQSMLSVAVDDATKQITGAMGGYVRFVYDANGKMQEILIMDAEDINTAHKVWRWNSGGLGYSSNGYGGPYGLAMTQNGAIVADFITIGVLNADLIGAGHVNANYIDATNLHVNAANIDGTLVIGQLPSDVATEGDIPTKTSDLTNDSGFQNSTQVTTITNNTISTTNVTAQNLKVKAANIDGTLVIGQLPSNVATDSDIPTKVSDLTNDSGFQNSTQVTTIAGNVISTAQLNADNISSGHLSANYIQGGNLTLGGSNNVNGRLLINNASGETVGIWDKDGITVRSGSIEGTGILVSSVRNGITIKNGNDVIGTWNSNGIDVKQGTINGPSITVGGNNNSSGTITVNNASGNQVGTWNKDGISVSSGTINGANITVGGNNNVSGTISVNYSSGNEAIHIDHNGIEVNPGADNFGMNIGPWGDIAVGKRPSNLSSFDNNKCGFQVNNFGTVKVGNLQIWKQDSSDIYQQVGSITGDLANNRINIDKTVNIGSGGALRVDDTATTLRNLKAMGHNSIESATITNANNTELFGIRFFQANACSNLPTSTSGTYYHVVFLGPVQIALQYSSNGPTKLWTRNYINSRWYPWTGVALS